MESSLPPQTPTAEVERYKKLLEAARQFSRAMDLDAFLCDILRSAKEVMAADACSIFLPEGADGDLAIHSALGCKAPMLGAMRIPQGVGVVGAVFKTQKTINIKPGPCSPHPC
jgi:signal transduction protein with GAF and PtsI domain